MNPDDLREMRKDITALIDDIKYHSDSLTDLDRLPVIQLKVILAKINKLTEKSTILLHYIEKEGRLSQKYSEETIQEEVVDNIIEDSSEKIEVKEVESPPDNSKSTNKKGDLNKLLVKDLFSAIGINEKYLYASTLFDGDTALLQAEVKALNELQSLEEAKTYIDKLAGKYAWDVENETVQNFVILVERKFDQF